MICPVWVTHSELVTKPRRARYSRTPLIRRKKTTTAAPARYSLSGVHLMEKLLSLELGWLEDMLIVRGQLACTAHCCKSVNVSLAGLRTGNRVRPGRQRSPRRRSVGRGLRDSLLHGGNELAHF